MERQGTEKNPDRQFLESWNKGGETVIKREIINFKLMSGGTVYQTVKPDKTLPIIYYVENFDITESEGRQVENTTPDNASSLISNLPIEPQNPNQRTQNAGINPISNPSSNTIQLEEPRKQNPDPSNKNRAKTSKPIQNAGINLISNPSSNTIQLEVPREQNPAPSNKNREKTAKPRQNAGTTKSRTKRTNDKDLKIQEVAKNVDQQFKFVETSIHEGKSVIKHHVINLNFMSGGSFFEAVKPATLPSIYIDYSVFAPQPLQVENIALNDESPLVSNLPTESGKTNEPKQNEKYNANIIQLEGAQMRTPASSDGRQIFDQLKEPEKTDQPKKPAGIYSNITQYEQPRMKTTDPNVESIIVEKGQNEKRTKDTENENTHEDDDDMFVEEDPSEKGIQNSEHALRVEEFTNRKVMNQKDADGKTGPDDMFNNFLNEIWEQHFEKTDQDEMLLGKGPNEKDMQNVEYEKSNEDEMFINESSNMKGVQNIMYEKTYHEESPVKETPNQTGLQNFEREKTDHDEMLFEGSPNEKGILYVEDENIEGDEMLGNEVTNQRDVQNVADGRTSHDEMMFVDVLNEIWKQHFGEENPDHDDMMLFEKYPNSKGIQNVESEKSNEDKMIVEEFPSRKRVQDIQYEKTYHDDSLVKGSEMLALKGPNEKSTQNTENKNTYDGDEMLVEEGPNDIGIQNAEDKRSNEDKMLVEEFPNRKGVQNVQYEQTAHGDTFVYGQTVQDGKGIRYIENVNIEGGEMLFNKVSNEKGVQNVADKETCHDEMLVDEVGGEKNETEKTGRNEMFFEKVQDREVIQNMDQEKDDDYLKLVGNFQNQEYMQNTYSYWGTEDYLQVIRDYLNDSGLSTDSGLDDKNDDMVLVKEVRNIVGTQNAEGETSNDDQILVEEVPNSEVVQNAEIENNDLDKILVEKFQNENDLQNVIDVKGEF